MDVGVIAPEFPPEIGGVQTYAHEFVRELARRGHRVTVFTCPHPQGEAAVPGVQVIPVLKLNRANDRALLMQYAFDAWHVMNAAYAWLALDVSPVVVSVHGNDFLDPYFPVARPKLTGWPGLWRSSRWRPALEERLGKWLTRELLRRALPHAAHILANSRYTEQVFLERNPQCRGKTSAAMVGVSTEFMGPRPARSRVGRSRLVTVCRLEDPRKNVDMVLRALATLKATHDFSYTVMGDGPLRAGLEALAANLGIADRVAFTGFVDAGRLRALLGQSDLFVLASSIKPGSHEGFGISYLEANACGTPVLAARLAGAVEAVAEGVSGFFVDHPSPPSLAAALRRFLDGELDFDPAACAAFAARFTWAKVVDHALAHYPSPVTVRV